jgi:hypothetical protein
MARKHGVGEATGNNQPVTKISDVIQYIANCYTTWIHRDYGFFNILNELAGSVVSDRFTPIKNHQNETEPIVIDTLNHYSIPFKPTNKLYKLIDWGIHIKPSYQIMMNASDVATHDIANPTRFIVHRELRKYDPRFVNREGEITYNQLIDSLLFQKIFISPEITNRKFYLILLK